MIVHDYKNKGEKIRFLKLVCFLLSLRLLGPVEITSKIFSGFYK